MVYSTWILVAHDAPCPEGETPPCFRSVSQH